LVRAARRRHRAAAWVALALLLTTGGASAEEPARKRSSLGWSRLEGAESCIGTRDLAILVERLLGRAVFVSAAEGELSLDGRIKPGVAPERWTAVISLSDASGAVLGTRELSSRARSCRALDEPLSLAIALMIDPSGGLASAPAPASASASAPAPASAPASASAPAPLPRVVVQREMVLVPIDKPAPPPEPSEDDGWRGDGYAGPVLGFGLLPGVAAGGMVGALLDPPFFAPIEGSITVFQSREVTVTRGASASFFLFQGSVLVCPLWYSGRRRPLDPLAPAGIAACAGAQIGLLDVEGSAFDRSQRDVRPLVNIAARARATYRFLGPLIGGVGVTVAVPLVRERFVYREPDGTVKPIFEVSPVVAVPDLSFGVTFP
jgi:hypothetical protein